MSASALTLKQSETKESKLSDNTACLDPIVEEKLNYNQIICFNEPYVYTKMRMFDNELLQKYGYIKINKISNSLQGEVFKALNLKNNKYVAIKRTNKLLYSDSIAIQDDTTFCVSENIIKESLILHHLTVSNKCIGGYIIRFYDFLESDTDYYLVLEYVKSELNMRQFVNICYKYINQGKFDLRDYLKMIKYLYWQLAVTVQWLHDSMNCCHMDICMENIMIANANFILGKDGKYTLDKRVCIKLIDFGVAERFHITPQSGFECNKQKLSLDNEAYLAPKVYLDRTYDARSADVWSLGMVLYECLTGNQLYQPHEIWECEAVKFENIPLKNSGYWSLHNNKLHSFVAKHNYNKYRLFKRDSFDLLSSMLRITEETRFNAMSVLQHKWFKSYYNSYCQQIEKKQILQKRMLEKQRNILKHFPFYAFEKFNADNVI
eukprot:405872_1